VHFVLGEDRDTHTVRVQPAFTAFCKDLGTEVSACRPYRARRGKTESGVGYIKRNAIAGLAFASFAALEAHQACSLTVEANQRVHDTTHEQPRVRFERDEQKMLRPLPSTTKAVRGRRVPHRDRLLRRHRHDSSRIVSFVRRLTCWSASTKS
jgi:hypothetical protein